jgi:hypothetical protein
VDGPLVGEVGKAVQALRTTARRMTRTLDEKVNLLGSIIHSVFIEIDQPMAMGL